MNLLAIIEASISLVGVELDTHLTLITTPLVPRRDRISRLYATSNLLAAAIHGVLTNAAQALEAQFEADVMSYVGPIHDALLNEFCDFIEGLAQNRKPRLVVLIKTPGGVVQLVSRNWQANSRLSAELRVNREGSSLDGPLWTAGTSLDYGLASRERSQLAIMFTQDSFDIEKT